MYTREEWEVRLLLPWSPVCCSWFRYVFDGFVALFVSGIKLSFSTVWSFPSWRNHCEWQRHRDRWRYDSSHYRDHRRTVHEPGAGVYVWYKKECGGVFFLIYVYIWTLTDTVLILVFLFLSLLLSILLLSIYLSSLLQNLNQ